jgi:hypothetical protein
LLPGISHRTGTAALIDAKMKHEIVFQQREIEVVGTAKRRTVYAADGRCWWSNLGENRFAGHGR